MAASAGPRPRKPMLAEGGKAPDFALPDASGRLVTLSSYRGKRVIVYFYPKDLTPGCTKEACSFQASLADLHRVGAVVLGISRDGAASHRRFAERYGLTFPLLSDPDASVSRAYGVFARKVLYGLTVQGIVRTTFLIDESGRITRVFPKVRVDGHAQEILEALKATLRRGPRPSLDFARDKPAVGPCSGSSRARPKAASRDDAVGSHGLCPWGPTTHARTGSRAQGVRAGARRP